VTRAIGRSATLLGVAVLVAVGAVISTPEPAAAHGVGGIQPSNYETRIVSVRPAVAGLEVRSVDLGNRLEVTNRTGHEVVILGYDREPYLRVGPRGVYENVRSPATYVNRTLTGGTPVPARADSDARPVWRRVGDGPVARWHDHRAHWSVATDPPGVRAAPDRAQIVQRFRVELRDHGEPVVVHGFVRWVPGSSAWPWIGLALVLAGSVIALSRTRFARVGIAAVLVTVVVLETAHVIGGWGATTESTGTRLGASVYALGAIAVAVIALVWLLQRGLHAAAPLVLIAGLFLGLAGGLADVSVLTRSQLPTTLPYGIARAIVAVALGLGAGLTIAGALRLRPEPALRRRAPSRPLDAGP
jgi:hypothetical protein